MTGVEHTREATVTLGDGCTINLVAEYEATGEFRALVLTQDNTSYPNGTEETLLIAELEYAEEFVAAILAVLPTRPAETNAGEDDDSLDAVERAKALREEAMILSSAAGHLKQARRHQDGRR